MQKDFTVLLYYKYVRIDEPEQFAKEHRDLCRSLNLHGRILVSQEGLNGTVSGVTADAQAYKEALWNDSRFADIEFKEDTADHIPFGKLKIKVRPEVVTLEAPHIAPENGGEHLSPEEWHELAQQEDVVILDARNNFESAIGKFQNAVTPDIEYFREFPQWVRDHKTELQNKKVLMYCTGGIRCEKASAVIKDEGIEEVYQLHGGIINYGKHKPDGLWEGSCYVFDERMKVQVNDDTHHTVISQCEHCDTATDDYYNCCNAECNKQILLCEDCVQKSNQACSEECSQKHRAGSVKTWNVFTRTAE